MILIIKIVIIKLLIFLCACCEEKYFFGISIPKNTAVAIGSIQTDLAMSVVDMRRAFKKMLENYLLKANPN